MKLSIVTINYNNAEGLQKTLASVATQTYKHVEHIIIDGGSTDNSVDVIKEYVRQVESGKCKVESVVWVSEKDKGIYNAINKGIQRATGDYIQILNSGDLLAANDVVERIMEKLKKNDFPELLYGNAVDVYEGKRLAKHGPNIQYSLKTLYQSTYPHDSTFFKRELFSKERYGLYDENLKIVSDWKWYLLAIGLGKVKPVYVDIDVALFDVTGISSTHKDLDKKERRCVLEEVLPPTILTDLDDYVFPITQYQRLKKHHLWSMVYLIERILFKLEKWHLIK